MAKNMRTFTPEEQVQRAFDREQIKNVFAKHCYCHLALRHDLEMEKIWAHNAPNVSWGFPTGFQVGRDTVWDFYVKPNLAKTAPPSVCRMHTLTTPLIEIAGDGQTAQGMWFTPGFGPIERENYDPKDGQPLQGEWIYEHYAVDFIKENGQWKIWHMFVAGDFNFEAGTKYEEPEMDCGGQEIKWTAPGVLSVPRLATAKWGWSRFPHWPEPYETWTPEIGYGADKFMEMAGEAR